jgi:hypothetical protein
LIPAAATNSEQDPARSKPEDSRRRFELLQDCRELVISRLSKVIGEALNRMSEELSGLALKSKDPDEQRSLLDAVSVVRQHRTEIELRFRRSFTDVFERRLFNRRNDNAEISSDELALVDDSVLQAKLAVDRLVDRTRGKLDPDEVLGIRARFGALLDRDWFDEERHPASPEAVFEALKGALSELAPRPEVQSALLDAFEPHVSANLNQVYSTVNDRLRSNHVLPKIRAQVTQQADKKRPSSEDRTEPSAEPPAMRGTPAADEARPISAAEREINAVLAQLSSGSIGARESATRMLSDPETFAVADLPIPSVEPPLLEAISHLQASSASGPVVPAQLLADLGDRAKEKGSALDQLTVEIVSMVFDYIYADKRLADVVKHQLLRLQVVAVKAALIDRSFFARRQHPMRRLIDRITEVAADPDAELAAGSALVTGVEEVVESVLLGFDCDLGIFDDARERVEALAAEELARRAERIAQITREAEHAEAVAHVRGLTLARLHDRLDPDTPEFMRTFIDDWWSLALAEAQVEGASAAIGFDEALSVAEGLIWSVAPKFPEEVPRLASLLPKMINGLMRGVRMVAMPDDQREAFFDALLKAHTGAIGAAKQTAAAAAARKPSNLRMRSDGKIHFAPVAPPSEPVRTDPPTVEARSLMLGELSRGDSIEVDPAGTGDFQAYRLAWISPAQRLYVLSRYPEGALSLDRGQLAALFDSGRARIREAGSPLDKAIESIATGAARQAREPAPEAVPV